YRPYRLFGKGPFEFGNHTLKKEFSFFELDNKKDGDTLRIEDISKDYPFQEAKFKAYSELFGDFYIIIQRKIHLNFQIYFDNIVNMYEVRDTFRLFHPDYNFSFLCQPGGYLNSINDLLHKNSYNLVGNILYFNNLIDRIKIYQLNGV